jgi:hypothetical protein
MVDEYEEESTDVFGMPKMVKKYNITYRDVKEFSRPCCENIPPTEFYFDLKARDIKTAFVAHRKKIHRKKLMAEYGVSADDYSGVISRFEDSSLQSEMLRDLGGVSFLFDKNDKDNPWIYECYIMDYDDEGQEVPMVITMFGDRAIRSEKNSYGQPPFVVASPIIMPHRMCGRGVAELVVDLQKLKTMLTRFMLDNVYFQNSGMMIVNPFRLNADSLKSANRPGGVAFTKFDIDPSSAVFPVPMKPMPSYVMQFLEYCDVMKENRVGVTRYNQGLDSKTLNKTATGISIITTAAQQRIELIARIFAETGVRDLFRALVQMNIDYFDQAVNIKLNDDWVQINPEDIDGKFDVVVDVGAGVGSKEMQFQQKTQMLQTYGMIAKILGPASQTIFGIENVKNIIKGMWEDLGYKDTMKYVAPDMPPGMGQAGMMPPGLMMPPMGGMNGPGRPEEMGGPAGPGAGGGATAGAPDFDQLLRELGSGMPSGVQGGGPQGY